MLIAADCRQIRCDVQFQSEPGLVHRLDQGRNIGNTGCGVALQRCHCLVAQVADILANDRAGMLQTEPGTVQYRAGVRRRHKR